MVPWLEGLKGWRGLLVLAFRVMCFIALALLKKPFGESFFRKKLGFLSKSKVWDGS